MTIYVDHIGRKESILRLAHIVSHLDEEAAGPSYSVSRLCESLASLGEQVDVHTMATRRTPIGVNLILHKQWALLGQFGFSLGIIRGCLDASHKADVVHNHSLWAFPNMAAGLTTGAGCAILVTSPRGTLAPVARARSPVKKFLFKPLQWPAITRATCLHATSQMEYEDIRRIGLKQPVAVIPNGIDIPDMDVDVEQRDRTAPARMLFLGRLHPIKGIEMLLQAWGELQTTHPGWELVIAGKGEAGYVRGLREMAVALRLERVSFPGPVYGAEKEKLYYSSSLFVLPTKTENFGMAIAEALAHGLPVITTRGAPWAGLINKQCGWWVERNQQAVVECFDQAMRLEPPALKEMGQRGRQWMTAEFNWLAIARRMDAVYKWLCKGGEVPPWVMTR